MQINVKTIIYSYVCDHSIYPYKTKQNKTKQRSLKD